MTLVRVLGGAGVVSPVAIGILIFEWENAGFATVSDSLAGKACFKALETVCASSRNIRSSSTSLELSLCTFETTATLVEGIVATLTAGWGFRTLEVLDEEANAGGCDVKVEQEKKEATAAEEPTIGGRPRHFGYNGLFIWPR